MNFRFNLNSITTRITLFGVMILIVGMLTRAYIMADYLRKEIVAQTTAQMLTLANHVAQDIDDSIVARRDFLQRLATKLPPALLTDPRSLQAWLADRHDVNPLFTSGMMVIDATGTALGGYPALPERIDTFFSDGDYFQQALTQKFAIGRPVTGKAGKAPALPMAVPVRDSSGKARAVLIGLTALDNSSFLNSLNTTHIGTTGGLLLISPRDHLFIGASNARMALKPTPKEGVNLLHDRAMNGFRGTGMTVNAYGIEELVGIASIPSSDWFAVARMPTSEAFAPIARLHRFIFKATAIVLPFFILIMVFWLRHMLRPLRNSARHADRMTLGKAPLEQLPVGRNDEVGHLTEAFNRLLLKLLESNSELAQSQKELGTMLKSVKNSEELLRETQLIAGLGAYVLDIPTGRWNSSELLDKILGIDEAYERSIEGWGILIHPDDRAAMTDYLKNEVLAQGKSFDREYRIIRHNDQAVRWLHGIGKLEFDAQGHPLKMLGAILDITEKREREAELATNRERLHHIEKHQTLSRERQRLMQDMHDGLGSSLISALRVVERGQLNEADITQVLKGCIDDLKLAIDSMEPVEADLLLLLATLRFRLGPRLESTGIALRWEVENVPPLDWLDPRNALHILRILQEAFTNIIKHTNATEIRVATRVENDYVLVTITDNGQGFSVAKALASGGKGLSNQMRRAESIAAKIQWDSNDTGTRMTLHLPIKSR